MYTEKKVTADVALVAPVAFTALPAAACRINFSVEEAEMFTTMSFNGTLSATVGEQPVDFTLFLDNVDIMAPLVDGMVRDTFPATAGLARHVNYSKTMRVAPGNHTLEMRLRAAAGNVSVLGLLRPATISAERWTTNSVVPAGANSIQTGGGF